MEQIISTLYHENEQYHNVKDKMVWLVVTGYLAFWAGYMKWILTYQFPTTAWNKYKVYLAGFLVLITIFAAYFAAFQNWRKVVSVHKTEIYDAAILRLDTGLTYKKLLADIKEINVCFFQGNLSREGQPGNWLIVGVLVLGVVGFEIIIFLKQLELLRP